MLESALSSLFFVIFQIIWIYIYLCSHHVFYNMVPLLYIQVKSEVEACTFLDHPTPSIVTRNYTHFMERGYLLLVFYPTLSKSNLILFPFLDERTPTYKWALIFSVNAPSSPHLSRPIFWRGSDSTWQKNIEMARFKHTTSQCKKVPSIQSFDFGIFKILLWSNFVYFQIIHLLRYDI
jgi:hypothetical protein